MIEVTTRRRGAAACGWLAGAACTWLAGLALAGPGAHGPNGEHLDAAPGAVVADTAPRLEAVSELYEIVARLEGGRLHVFVDAYATNEPVLGAAVEVEAGELKAKGRFDAATGDYVFDDAKLVATLGEPVKHTLVFTVEAGDDADLLEGQLIPAADAHDHAHGGLGRWWFAIGGLAVLIAGALAWRVRRRGGFGGGVFRTGEVA